MTTRTIIIDIDTSIGNKLYWFLKELMKKYPNEIKEKRKNDNM